MNREARSRRRNEHKELWFSSYPAQRHDYVLFKDLNGKTFPCDFKLAGIVRKLRKLRDLGLPTRACDQACAFINFRLKTCNDEFTLDVLLQVFSAMHLALEARATKSKSRSVHATYMNVRKTKSAPVVFIIEYINHG